jgi:ubiquinone/menaquinone biosynthesis C-methylase UbiE
MYQPPRLSILNLLVEMILQRKLAATSRKYLTGCLIDIGCGTKPYKNLLSPYLKSHIGIDHKNTLNDKSDTDIIGTAYAIPAVTEKFDCALCTAVLEHLEEPEIALHECYRVLKKRGIAIYSVPFIWHLHEEPRDYYRFSKYGLKYLFEKVGFEIIEITALSGFWVTFGQLFVYNIYRLNSGPLRFIPIIPMFGILIQIISYLLDKLDKTEQWTWMYIVVARKP